MPNARLYFVHALSPLHAGTGHGTGVIDMPIAREKATGIPYLPGSSVKGTLKDLLRDNEVLSATEKKLFFGPDTDNADEHASAAQFADARLLLLPVRSLRGTFAWVTSPYLLQRLAREAKDAGIHLEAECTIPTFTSRQEAFVSGDAITYQGNKVIIEDLDLNIDLTKSSSAAAWATWIGKHAFGEQTEREMLAKRLCIVHDDALSFLLNTATEVVARIRLDPEKKTVEQGALWYEEALPTESVLVGIALGQTVKDRNGTAFTSDQVMQEMTKLNGLAAQFGGKATVGRGLCRVRIAGGAQ